MKRGEEGVKGRWSEGGRGKGERKKGRGHVTQVLPGCTIAHIHLTKAYRQNFVNSVHCDEQDLAHFNLNQNSELYHSHQPGKQNNPDASDR